jgi:hypothetical protein
MSTLLLTHCLGLSSFLMVASSGNPLDGVKSCGLGGILAFELERRFDLLMSHLKSIWGAVRPSMCALIDSVAKVVFADP